MTHSDIAESRFREWCCKHKLPRNVWFEHLWPIGDEKTGYTIKFRQSVTQH